MDVAAEKKKGYNLGIEHAFHLWVSITSDFISRLRLFYKIIEFPLLNISKQFYVSLIKKKSCDKSRTKFFKVELFSCTFISFTFIARGRNLFTMIFYHTF